MTDYAKINDAPPEGGTPLDHTIVTRDPSTNRFTMVWSAVDPHQYIPKGHVRTASGLFQFDPANGWGLNRKQVVTAFTVGDDLGTGGHSSPNFIALEFYAFKKEADGSFTRIVDFGRGVQRSDDYSFFTNLDLSVGNYLGHGRDGKQTSPLMYPVIGYVEHRASGMEYHGLRVITTYQDGYWDTGRILFRPDAVTDNDLNESTMPVAVTALDGDGDTWRLGRPMHISIPRLVALDFIIQEPPKHVDYLPKDPLNWSTSEWEVVNVSAFSDFYVEFGEKEENSCKTTKKDTSTYAIGGSYELDVKMQAAGGFPGIAKVTATLELAEKISYDYQSSKASWDSSYKSQTTSFTTKTEKSGAPDQAYTFRPAFYFSGGGMFKVAHAVDPLGSSGGRQWWLDRYAGRPDPALNLPFRFLWNPPYGADRLEYWTLNENQSRMQMRGFYIRSISKDKDSQEYPLLDPASVYDGDKVQLCAQVYNFSLDTPTGAFDVLFQYVPIDGRGTPMGPLVEIGTVRTSLGAFETDPFTGEPSTKEVCIPWDTKGLGNTPYAYRFYVVVDPDNEVEDEIHEWKYGEKKLTHGNNEGYWPWGTGLVVHPPKGLVMALKPSAFMDTMSLEIKTEGAKLESEGPIKVLEGQRYRLRARIVAADEHTDTHYTIFFDGPAEDGKIIAIRRNFGLSRGDNYVWIDWTPLESGNHELYAYYTEHEDDPVQGDAWDSLEVEVESEPWRNSVIRALQSR